MPTSKGCLVTIIPVVRTPSQVHLGEGFQLQSNLNTNRGCVCREHYGPQTIISNNGSSMLLISIAEFRHNS
ncbi:hypothetical protein P879_03289 [Paragonimus westermani]|uniref:Uncharacterized protein n=1 Tax=Paragonimus westermani TaxID=34504 RepID=A0A8T0D950_9TREM|nr:hypothetical protein P879_03289 [Paragonimus westermani]